ncbi:hypothetical protein DXG01_006173 [Tephrocybe rancida]|nr:hypothetical protein DXG01_006173 [Tephrocybe rancida]
MALRAGKDVIGVVATGAGKTLSFWIPLLMALDEGLDKMAVIVTPLNLLGKQAEAQLNLAGLSCIAVNKQNNNPSTYKDIASGKYHVVTISPELLNEQPCYNVIENPKVAGKFLYFIFDEGHCVSQWGNTFRNEYLYVSNLCYLLASEVLFYVASATLPPPILTDVHNILRLHPNKLEKIIYSNDRPNIHLVIPPMEHSISSYRDLAFLIPDNFTVNSPQLLKFLVFSDSTTSTEDALHGKIKWFHSTMTPAYCEEEFERFRNGEVWGKVVTDAFGMYHVPSNLCTLWQCFGRAGRAANSEATAILLVEKQHFDDKRKKKKKDSNACKAKAKHKHKAPSTTEHPAKWIALATTAPVPSIAATATDHDTNAESESGTGDSVPIPSISDLVALQKRSNDVRQAAYHKAPPPSVVEPKQWTLEVGSALDDLINAPTRLIKC